MKNLFAHFKMITTHKWKVTRLCFKVGLYKQGLLHDLSKYSWIEFSGGMRYYQGDRSPIDKEKEIKGYSLGWLHHKGRNKHHWEYWLDNSNHGVVALEMPEKYVVEMFCDRVIASQLYQKDAFTNDSPLQYYVSTRQNIMIHPNTDALILHLLTYLSTHTLETTISYIRSKQYNTQIEKKLES